ncbi:MAG TPA: DEAD/DEAH box helicase [Acidimicrobiia bacterium]|nr:DEAD/DEAH box helicase [Acidimicrobiia bacterium]
MSTFADLGVPADLLGILNRAGITDPFPIQAATIPDALAGKDVCGRAPTGSGKTLAFGVPILTTVAKAKPGRPRALVLAPTRELAEQIRNDLAPLAKARQRWVGTIYGGVSYERQRRELNRGVDVLIACPGRLADLIERGWIRLDEVETVVVDEADRMADMGFLPEVRRLLDQTPSNRQTMLFSATLDGEVAQLTRRYQRQPVRHEVGTAEPEGIDVRHFFWRAAPEERLEHTATAVAATGSAIVFTRTRHSADKVAKQLARLGVDAVAIHGGRSQSQRNRALNAFSTGRSQVLVATDVAARGIHVEGVACVIHFDPPVDAKTYLHRSGRTARAGASGVVVSMVSGDQARAVGRIQKELGLVGPLRHPVATELGSGGLRVGASLQVRTRPETVGDVRGRGSHHNRRRVRRGATTRR